MAPRIARGGRQKEGGVEVKHLVRIDIKIPLVPSQSYNRKPNHFVWNRTYFLFGLVLSVFRFKLEYAYPLMEWDHCALTVKEGFFILVFFTVDVWEIGGRGVGW